MILAYLYKFKSISNKTVISLLVVSFGTLILFDLPSILFHPSISICFACLILLFMQIAIKIKQNKVFQLTEYLGKFTYGLYIYSGFIITLGVKFLKFSNPFLNFSIQFISLLFVAILSFYTYEKFFLNLKKRFY